jgi:hypothetical protein
VLYPAIAEAAHCVGANAVGLIDVGCSAGLNLHVDRVGITYRNGQSLGDPSSPVQLSSSVVGGRPVPARAMPDVASRSSAACVAPPRRRGGRPVAWVSAEGVGVAPAIPTLGDRRASGHSIIGLAVFDGPTLRAEAVGRCWSQGRLLAWPADT